MQNRGFKVIFGPLVCHWRPKYDKFDLGTVLVFIKQLISNLEPIRYTFRVFVGDAKMHHPVKLSDFGVSSYPDAAKPLVSTTAMLGL